MHNIYKEKFIAYRRPAWHNLGTVINEEISATEAAQRIKLPKIWTEPVIPAASNLPTGHKAIIGQNDEGRSVFSVVTDSYHEVTHEQFIETWDRVVKTHIETIGLLGKGETLFVTAKLPQFDVKGDAVESFLLCYNPLTGHEAITGRITGVRVVCQNTLQASGTSYTKQARVLHSQDAVPQMATFLKELWEGTVAQVETLREVFELLATTPASDNDVREVLESVYPSLPQPTELLTRTNEKEALDQLAAWERENGRQLVHRDQSFGLWAGQGVGSMTPAAVGTAWGGYNAVVEYEQYLKRFSRPESFVFGAGADRTEKAFDGFLALAK